MALLAVDFEQGVTDAWRQTAAFVPRFLGFLIILLIGYLVAKAVATILDKVLERVGFDRAVERGGVAKALSKSKYDASDIVAKIAFYFIFVAALSMAFSQLGIAALEAPMASLLTLLPKILVAIVLIVIGAAIATAAKGFLSNTLGGLSYGNAVATGVAVLVMVLFGKAALDQIGVAVRVTDYVMIAVLATAAGIAIVGVGGGLIRPMQTRWEDMLNKASDERENVKNQVQAQKAQSQPYPAEPVVTDPATTQVYGKATR